MNDLRILLDLNPKLKIIIIISIVLLFFGIALAILMPFEEEPPHYYRLRRFLLWLAFEISILILIGLIGLIKWN